MTDTRERFISAATKMFAERGFYGTSIASIADRLPFTKQALLHHFGSKEKLYAEVLKRISARLMHELELADEHSPDARQRVEDTFIAIYRSAVEHRDDTQLLMRELLDNRRRAETSRSWYLKPFLEKLTQLTLQHPDVVMPSRHAAMALVYQLLGAINYFAVSEPTLDRMLGKNDYARVRSCFESQLRILLGARLRG